MGIDGYRARIAQQSIPLCIYEGLHPTAKIFFIFGLEDDRAKKRKKTPSCGTVWPSSFRSKNFVHDSLAALAHIEKHEYRRIVLFRPSS